MPDWELPALVTPFRFGIVEDGLYRGAYPTLKNWRFLRRLQLRAVVTLSAEPPTADLRDFCRHEQIRLWHWHAEKFEDIPTLATSRVTLILQCILDPRNHPLFIHCRDGGHNTGLVIMCLRRLQNWNLSVIFSEFCRYVKGGEIRLSESQYVESFKGEVLLPTELPMWLWGGRRITRHPYLRLRYADGTATDGFRAHNAGTMRAPTLSETKPAVRVAPSSLATVPTSEPMTSFDSETAGNGAGEHPVSAHRPSTGSMLGQRRVGDLERQLEQRSGSWVGPAPARWTASLMDLNSTQRNDNVVMETTSGATTGLQMLHEHGSGPGALAFPQINPDKDVLPGAAAESSPASSARARPLQWPDRTVDWEYILSHLVFGNHPVDIFVDIVDSATLRRLLRVPRLRHRDGDERENVEEPMSASSKLTSRRGKPKRRRWRDLTLGTNGFGTSRSEYSQMLQALVLDERY
jgi:tyrosine-protein phosphatase OCA6